MKHLILSMFVLIAMTAKTQTDEIDNSCKEYDEKITQANEEEMTELVPKMQISCQLTKRAIGPVDHLITIYFDEYEIEIGQPGQDVFNKEAVIRKAEFTISSVSYTTTYTYYFNEGGLLIKHIIKETGYSCYLKQYYFKTKQAIRIKQDAITGEECMSEEKTETYDKTNLSKGDKASASWLLEDADKFRQILFNNYELFKN